MTRQLRKRIVAGHAGRTRRAPALPRHASILLACLLVSCAETGPHASVAATPQPSVDAPAKVATSTSRAIAGGTLTRMDAAFDNIVSADAMIETIADGLTWAEGPVWVDDGGYLLFTDVPENTLYRWDAEAGLTVLLQPSGFAGADAGDLREAGANGLATGFNGSVLLADSGNRLLASLDPGTGIKTTLVDAYRGKPFNSPNDVVQHLSGAVFFTDPPYGLKGLDRSPVKVLAFNGVYRMAVGGNVDLVDDGLRFPNGIAVSPDQRTLYVSNSDPQRPIWMAYTLDADGEPVGKRVFADAADLMGDGVRGLPDGMAIAADGTIFASAPGGVLVMDPMGKRLGRIETGDAVSNCAFGDDGHTLYMTSHTRVLRMRVKPIGTGFASGVRADAHRQSASAG